MSFAIRIAAGVRIAPSRRGLRTGFGPLPTPVHLGSGRSGSGPFSYWSSVSARDHHQSGETPLTPDLSELGSRIRRATRPAEIADAAKLEAAVIQAHVGEFPAIEAPNVAPPEPIDVAAVTSELRSQSLLGAGRWHVGARRKAEREALAEAPKVIQDRRRAASAEYQATLAEAKSRFEALVTNEPEAVLGALEASFELGERPAAPIDCASGGAAIVIRLPPLSAVPPSKPMTGTGKANLQARTESERHRLYLTVLASTVLATVRQTLANAPGLSEVRVLAVRPIAGDHELGPLEAVYAGRFEAETVNHVPWAEIDPVDEISRVPDHLLHLRGSARQVIALDLSDEPDLAAVLTTLRHALHPVLD